ncbi:MAG: methyltransferase domain-containing protein [Nanoarchaeota archaeon]|nr:methyltransferase domain-containing protein [Nanoarchaeota archaeon]
MENLFRCPDCHSLCMAESSVVVCKSCKKPYPITAAIFSFGEDKDTKTWDSYWKRVPIYDEILDFLRKMMNLQLKRYLKKYVHPSEKTLEPGGGSAYVSAMLQEEGQEAFALDYAALPLKIARDTLKSKATLVQGDMFNMPFVNNSFDLTFNNSTLEHFSNPGDALKEMVRVTKPGKFVFVGVPFTYGPLAMYKLKKSSFKGAWDGKTYDRTGLKKLFKDAGLEIVGSRTFFFRCFVGVVGKKTEERQE